MFFKRLYKVTKLPYLSIFSVLATCTFLVLGGFTSGVSARDFSENSNTSKGITALAMKPDGSALYAAGRNFVIYKLDPKTLKVIDRFPVIDAVRKMAFSKDGKNLFTHTFAGALMVYDSKTMKVKSGLRSILSFSYAQKANKLVVAVQRVGYKNENFFELNIFIGELDKFVKRYKVKGRFLQFSVNSAATIISIITRPKHSAEEKRKRAPLSLNYLERKEFSQKNDARISEHIAFRVADGKQTRAWSWFSMNRKPTYLTRVKDGVYAFSTADFGGAYIQDSGETRYIHTLAQSQQSVLYDENEKLLILGLRIGFAVKSKTATKATIFEFEAIRSLEAVTSIVKGKNAYFGSTNHYRVMRLDPINGIKITAQIY